MLSRRKVSDRGSSTRNNFHRLSNASNKLQPNEGNKFTQLGELDTNNNSSLPDSGQIFITYSSPINKSRQDSVVTQNKRSNKVEKVNE